MTKNIKRLIKKILFRNKKCIKDNLIVNILHIIDALIMGGAEKHLLTLLAGLNKNRYNSIVCCFDKKGVLIDEIRNNGVKVITLQKKGKIDFRIFFSLCSIIKREKISLVHTQMFTANFWGRLAAIFCRVPIVIITEHGISAQRMKRHIIANRLLSKFTDKIIVVSNASKELRLKQDKINLGKISVVHNGVDTNLFKPDIDVSNIKKEFGSTEAINIVGTIGSLIEVKGITYLLKSAPKILENVPKTKFLIVGDGPLKRQLMELVKNLRISDQVIFTGCRKEISKLMNIMDVFVLPSIMEDSPVVILEAMACGKPIVATKVGGVPEQIIDGKTGVLVAPKDSSVLTKAIIMLLQNKHFASRLSVAARTRVEKRFRADRMVKQIERIYGEFIFRKINKI